jgi:hypothetical protein
MPPQRNQLPRERGRALLSRINRWMIAGAVGFAGVISLVAARSFHGHTVSGSSGAVSQPAQSSSSAAGPGSSGSGSSGSGLSQPSQAPSSGSAPSSPAPVVSGGS